MNIKIKYEIAGRSYNIKCNRFKNMHSCKNIDSTGVMQTTTLSSTDDNSHYQRFLDRRDQIVSMLLTLL